MGSTPSSSDETIQDVRREEDIRADTPRTELRGKADTIIFTDTRSKQIGGAKPFVVRPAPEADSVRGDVVEVALTLGTNHGIARDHAKSLQILRQPQSPRIYLVDAPWRKP